jgi:hypothetical protein
MKSIKDFSVEDTEQYTMNERCGVLEFRCLNSSDYFTFVKNILLGCSFKDWISIRNGTNSAVEKFHFVTARFPFMFCDYLTQCFYKCGCLEVFILLFSRYSLCCRLLF